MRLLACLTVLSLARAAAAQVDPALAQGRLAVLDFRNKLANAKEVDATYFADVVRSAALKAVPGLKVITRENLIVLLQSTGRKLEECEGECEVDTGRRIGADLVISGDLLKIGSNYKLNLRLHETRGGQLVSGTVASGRTVDDLDANTTAAVAELLQPLREAAAQPPVTRRMPERHDGAPFVPQRQEPQRTAPTARKVGWGLIAGSVLLGGGAGYFALKGRALANEVSNGGLTNSVEIAQKASDSKATNLPAYLCAGAGLAALAGGIALVLLNPTQPAVATLSAGGLVVAGRF